MVLNIGWLLSGRHDEVQDDIAAVVDVSGDALVKVIFENAYLTDEQKVTACQLTEAAGADYVKTSTGFAPTGATIEDLRLMRDNVGPGVKVKAAHGVRTLDALLAVIEAGADRCGATATASMLDDYRARTGS
jgi:deoxyribose-phosphate aldolase